MDNNFAFRLLTSKFNEHRQLIKTTIVGNLLLVVPFLFNDLKFLWENLHVQFSILSALFILILYLFYDWKNSMVNLVIVVSYLGLFAMEYFIAGIPTNPMPPTQGIGKGILLDLLMMFVPWIYMGLRLSFIIPLIQVSLSSIKLLKSS